jgi:hypothetical protein
MISELKNPKVLLFICLFILLYVLAKWEKEKKIHEEFENCLTMHPDWAKEYYDPKTPKYEKRLIMDVCLGNDT